MSTLRSGTRTAVAAVRFASSTANTTGQHAAAIADVAARTGAPKETTSISNATPTATTASTHVSRTTPLRHRARAAVDTRFFPSNYAVPASDQGSSVARTTRSPRTKAVMAVSSGNAPLLRTVDNDTDTDPLLRLAADTDARVARIAEGIVPGSTSRSTISQHSLATTPIATSVAPLPGQPVPLDSDGLPAHLSAGDKAVLLERSRAIRAKRLAAAIMMVFAVAGLIISDYLVKVLPAEPLDSPKRKEGAAGATYTVSDIVAARDAEADAAATAASAASERQMEYRKQQVATSNTTPNNSSSISRLSTWLSPSAWWPWSHSTSPKTVADAEAQIRSVLQYKDK